VAEAEPELDKRRGVEDRAVGACCPRRAFQALRSGSESGAPLFALLSADPFPRGGGAQKFRTRDILDFNSVFTSAMLRAQPRAAPALRSCKTLLMVSPQPLFAVRKIVKDEEQNQDGPPEPTSIPRDEEDG
jgi:hypothetical protein